MQLVERRGGKRDFVQVMLADDHAHLERLFHEVVASARAGDPAGLRADWRRFESELSSHLDLEENEILPGFARQHQAEAQGIREEHDRIRATLIELGVALELHCLRAEQVEEFISILRRHARREEGVLYPWANRSAG